MLVFAFLALVAGQYAPVAPQYGPLLGAAPVPAYRAGYGMVYGGYGVPATAPAPASTVPSLFDIDQQLLNLRSEQQFRKGNDFIKDYNPFVPIGAADKFRGQQIQLRKIRRAKQNLVANSKGTQADQNALDDLALQATATKDQINRRGYQTFFPASPLPPLFEGKANQAQLTLAQNQLDDAQVAYQKNPSEDNWRALRQARQTVTERRQWLDANKADVIGWGNSLGRLGPINRLRASDTALDIAQQQHRQLVQKYATEPSEDNWWNLRISNVQLKALRQDIEANKGESLWLSTRPVTVANTVIGHFLNAASFQNEEDYWVKYQRLTLQNLQRQRAQAQAQGVAPNQAQAQLMALGSYGQQTSQQQQATANRGVPRSGPTRPPPSSV